MPRKIVLNRYMICCSWYGIKNTISRYNHYANKCIICQLFWKGILHWSSSYNQMRDGTDFGVVIGPRNLMSSRRISKFIMFCNLIFWYFSVVLCSLLWTSSTCTSLCRWWWVKAIWNKKNKNRKFNAKTLKCYETFSETVPSDSCGGLRNRPGQW